MRGYRKLILGLTFIVSSTALAVYLVHTGHGLVGVDTFVLAESAGLAAVIYGNIQEHKSNGTEKPDDQ
jgi:hypothetical protein